MVVSNGTLNQSISLGKPTNIAKYNEIVGLKDKFIKRLGILMTGVYEARKKSGEIYYRASFTYKNKHISLGSSSDEASCHAMYNEACEIINNSSDHWIDTDHRTTSYNEAMTLSLGKYISLINFRDNNIYIKTPIYMCHKYFLYFLKEHEVLQFSTDDLLLFQPHNYEPRRILFCK